jgi:putative oxidoreductase
MRELLRLRAWLEAVPYSVLALPLRFGVAWIFWNSAQVKLINWRRTIDLFTDEYRVPLLPPELAANMALSIEVAGPILLVLGLFTRAAVLVLLGMTAVIQTFVYPDAWPTHLQWTAMMLVLLCRGAGALSVDQLLWRWYAARLEAQRAGI